MSDSCYLRFITSCSSQQAMLMAFPFLVCVSIHVTAAGLPLFSLIDALSDATLLPTTETSLLMWTKTWPFWDWCYENSSEKNNDRVKLSKKSLESLLNAFSRNSVFSVATVVDLLVSASAAEICNTQIPSFTLTLDQLGTCWLMQ